MLNRHLWYARMANRDSSVLTWPLPISTRAELAEFEQFRFDLLYVIDDPKPLRFDQYALERNTIANRANKLALAKASKIAYLCDQLLTHVAPHEPQSIVTDYVSRVAPNFKLAKPKPVGALIVVQNESAVDVAKALSRDDPNGYPRLLINSNLLPLFSGFDVILDSPPVRLTSIQNATKVISTGLSNPLDTTLASECTLFSVPLETK